MAVAPINTQGLTEVTGTMPTTMTSPPPTPSLNGTLSGISQQLGMSVGDVQRALKQGSSITGLAQQQGVSRDSVVQSVQSQIQQKRQAGGLPPVDQTTLDRLVNRALDRSRGAQVSAAGAADTDGDADGSGRFSTFA